MPRNTAFSRWEKILKIHPKTDDTLDDRKFRILSLINDEMPFTMGMLKKIRIFCGEGNYRIELINDEYLLIVKISIAVADRFDDISKFLNRIIPANIVLDLGLDYNTHDTLSKFKHDYLSIYTHYELRNEVIE